MAGEALDPPELKLAASVQRLNKTCLFRTSAGPREKGWWSDSSPEAAKGPTYVENRAWTRKCLLGDFANRLTLLSLDFTSLGTPGANHPRVFRALPSLAVGVPKSIPKILRWSSKGNQGLARLRDIAAKITKSRAGRFLLGFMFSWEMEDQTGEGGSL